jgi:hypothetical protein
MRLWPAEELNLPKQFGFDEYCLWQHTRRPPRYANPGLEINGKGGEELQKMVNDMIGTPASVLEKVARAIQLNAAEAVRGARPDGG